MRFVDLFPKTFLFSLLFLFSLILFHLHRVFSILFLYLLSTYLSYIFPELLPSLVLFYFFNNFFFVCVFYFFFFICFLFLTCWCLTCFLISYKNKIFVRWTFIVYCICFYFDLVLHCNQSINGLVYFFFCNILPIYILHSTNIHDLGNSPVAYNIV